jgi:hypothetical protein
MYNVSAHAVRHHGWIEVTVTGLLPTSCHHARIADIYPGGNIIYIKDPGTAQVFVEETVMPGAIICAMVLVPWAGTVCIPDDSHNKVSIYVNKRKQLEIKVKEKNKAQFIVLQLTGGIVPNGDYSIVPAGTLYPAIYTKVYGPASYARCDQWIREHSKLHFSILDGVALGYGLSKEMDDDKEAEAEGGGSDAPRGLKVWLSGGSDGHPRSL